MRLLQLDDTPPPAPPAPKSDTDPCWGCSGTGVEFDDFNRETCCPVCAGRGFTFRTDEDAAP